VTDEQILGEGTVGPWNFESLSPSIAANLSRIYKRADTRLLEIFLKPVYLAIVMNTRAFEMKIVQVQKKY
jgi:hypothetical protein